MLRSLAKASHGIAFRRLVIKNYGKFFATMLRTQPPSSSWSEFSGASEKSNLIHLGALVILELTFLAAAVYNGHSEDLSSG